MKTQWNWNGFKTENEMINNGIYRTEYTAEEMDPRGIALNTPGAKADAGKLRPWLVLGGFSNALEDVCIVGTLGASKYTDNGWKTVPNGKERYLEAAMRHLLKAAQGEEYDIGPGGIGTKHLAQVAWNVLAALELSDEKSSSKA